MTTSSRKTSWRASQNSVESSPKEEFGNHFSTCSIHDGLDYQKETGAVIPPVYLTSTFESDNPGGFDYTRSGNPNFRNLEQVLSSLENAVHATAFSSGVGAITAVASTLKSGDRVLAEENVYGCTYRLFEQVFRKFGVSVEYLDFTQAENIARISSQKPELVWLESPTNPLLKIIDIKAVSDVAEKVGATVLVDNTFASSYFQKPLDLGAHLSLSSLTKYSNGHSDSIGGIVCTNSAEWEEKMSFARKALGLNPSPLDCWLTSRGLKTLELRMERHEKNAFAVTEWLMRFPYVRHLRYPFHPSHPQYEIARRQMLGGSGIVTAEFDLSLEETRSFLKNLRIFTLAESLGGVESLVCHPASMTHAAVPKEEKERIGISDSLVRFSVGIEAAEDLVADIEQSFFKVREQGVKKGDRTSA